MSAVESAARTASPWLPHPATIEEIRQEVPGIATYRLALAEAEFAAAYRFRAGQFNMLYVPGVGESAISVSSDPGDSVLLHTIRIAGNVTRALAQKKVGDQVAIRGPFGSSWPMEASKGRDIVIACGGVGLAPLRPAIYDIIAHRGDYGRVFLLYGARTPGDLLYAQEYDAWREADVEVQVTVDIGDQDWRGNMGVVPVLFYRLRLDAARTVVLTCGPEIMIRFVVFEALARKIAAERIFLSMERNMNCAIDHCGHCQLGPAFICKDGPIFSYRQMEPYMHLEDY
jgi:NAD(P)H-flavin reductase